jgi:predicted nucleic-acid-binding Zn-ribbon protein
MYFNYLLSILFGETEVLYSIECPVCGFDEVYYKDKVTGKQIGRACEGCNFVQKFDFD